ncbi:MAG TPA: hypothetical protein VHM20_07215, partial [Gammaproteobacteria bacterium]|nr:hypothetical protein [Gammaproteobacteria bacterium]
KNLIYLSNDFWFHIKKIEALIKNNNIENKYELLTILFHFALNNLPYQTSLSPQQFKQYISFVKKQCIHENNVEAKKIYLYLDLLKLIETQDDVFVIQICDMMEEVEISVGNDNFILIAEKILQHQLSIEECIILFNIALQLRQTSVTTLLDLMDKHQNDVTSIKYEMNDTLLKEYQLKYPERPLDEVIRDFLTKSDDVEYPIEAVELKQLENRYLQIKSLGEKLFLTGWLGLQSELTNCHLTLKKEPNNEDAILTLLAIIRLQVMENLKINPYNLQMLNLLALINEPRRIAQIKTGEGKSTLIAMLAAYYGLMRHEVDIITTSADLAVRDAKKFEKFYESLDLSVSHAVNKNTSGFFNDCIVYGTVSDFEFAYLRGETQGKFVGRRNRAYDVAIVDEVDSMFIDMQRNQSILSRSSDEVYSSDIYPCIWHWIENTEIPHKTKENLQAELQSKGFEVPLELANTWLKSARTAQAYSENKEYIIDVAKDEESSCIKIVDKLHTGQIASETTRWQGGLHQ